MRRRDPFAWWLAAAFALAVAVRWLVFARWYRDLPIGDGVDHRHNVDASLRVHGAQRGMVVGGEASQRLLVGELHSRDTRSEMMGKTR